MDRVCIEYELQESLSRPASLLDALDQGDHCRGAEEDSLVVEEKVTNLISFYFLSDVLASTCQEAWWKKRHLNVI